MEIIPWIVFGTMVGWIASRTMPAHAHQGTLLTILAGSIGATVGGWLASVYTHGVMAGIDPYTPPDCPAWLCYTHWHDTRTGAGVGLVAKIAYNQ